MMCRNFLTVGDGCGIRRHQVDQVLCYVHFYLHSEALATGTLLLLPLLNLLMLRVDKEEGCPCKRHPSSPSHI